MNRRQFLRTTSLGVSALIVGCKSDGSPEILDGGDVGWDAGTPPDTTPPVPPPSADSGTWAWVRISEDNGVFLAINKAEMGQGVSTGLAMILAEELGAAWSQVHVVLEPEMGAFHIPSTGRAGTAESTSIRNQYPAVRKIGATARELLIGAAAKRWGVDAGALNVNGGQVVGGPNGEALDFGALVEDAKTIPIPEEVTLKDPADFSLIGTSPEVQGLEQIVNGTRIYGIDVEVEGLVYAAIRHAPVPGGEITNLDALSVEDTGADAVVGVPGGIAVVASSYWTANKVVKSLDAVFSAPAEAASFSTEDYRAALTEAVAGEGVFEAYADGDAEAALKDVATKVEASYEVPFLAHACMEPMTATAHVQGESCEMWAPTQGASSLAKAVAVALEMEVEKVVVNRTFLGTGFGRKVETDYGVQAALISKAVGKPVKLIWSREEDIRHDYYRPGFMCRMTGGLSADGALTAWHAVSAGESILADRGLPLPVDPVSLDGLLKLDGFTFESLPYKIPNQLVAHTQIPSPLQCGFWRSVGNSQNAFFVESFIDELAIAAETDPMTFRLALLDEAPRAKAVLQRLQEEASWGSPQTPGASQGVAFSHAYESYFALAVEVTVDEGKIHVHRATGVVDCGQTIHPDLVSAQLEGGVIFGMGAGLLNAITVKDGTVEQSNFHDFPMPLMGDSPEIQIIHIATDADPGGVGELGVGPAAPAIANAVYQATGQRLRTLPLTLAP